MFERFAKAVRAGRVSDSRFNFAALTDRGRRVVVLAQQEAEVLGHGFIGTEHLLLGLIEEEEGVAAKALESLGISFEAVSGKVEETIGPSGSTRTEAPPFTPRTMKVLELSQREARLLGHKYIGTEHILLGLVREGEGVAAQVLIKLGLDLSRVRQQVIAILSGYEPAESDRVPDQSSADLRSDRRRAPRCAVCQARLTDSLAYQVVDVPGALHSNSQTDASDGADGDDSVVQVALVYCTSCGVTLCSNTLPSREPPRRP